MRSALLGAVLCALAAWLAPPTADLAAQAFRTRLWESYGFEVWNFAWYGGHHLPSYSLTFPPLAALLGERVVGAIGGALAAALFAPLARATLPEQEAKAAALLFAVAIACGVWIGRMPFTLAVAFTVAAGLAAVRGRLVLAALASLVATATSPMAGLFLALAAVAWWWPQRERWQGPAALAAPAVATAATLALLFPDEGSERFVATAFWPALIASIAAFAALPRERAVLRAGAALATLLVLVAFVAPTPVGQNALRFGTLLGAPLLAGAALAAAPGRRRAALWGLTIVWGYLALLPAVRAVIEASGDPAAKRSLHTPLIAELDRRAAPGDKVEIPFTRNHWETAYVAPRHALARGWLRQLDKARNDLFYDGGELTATEYRAWLERERVRWVALPPGDVVLDFSARPEMRLIRSGRVRGLREVARPGGWTLYEVTGIRTVDGPGRIIAASPVQLTVQVDRPGAVVRLPGYRWSRWLGSPARRGRGGVLELAPTQPGPHSIAARLGR